MDIAKAFTYVTEDENWQNKVIITLVLGLIPVVNLAVVGWMLDLIRNMLDGVAHPMPDWDDLGGQITDRFIAGLMTVIAVVIYMIPFLVLAVCFGALVAISDSGFLQIIFSILTAIYVALIWMPLSIGMMRYSRTRQFSAYTDLSRNINLAREHLSTLIVLAVFVFVVGIVLGIIGSIPCIGWLINLLSVGVNAIVTGHLTGQAAVEISRAARGAG
ncbi:MAG: hypothetical protein Kow0077_27770 [Anaerolineae bacterium]